MYPRTCAYIFSTLLIASVVTDALSQKKEDKIPADTTARRFIPTSIRFGPDLVGFTRGQLMNDFKGWEVAADVDFYRYYLVAEYGTWSVYDLIDNGLYTNDGTYYRIGVDVNFLKNDPDKNMFFLGGRFGHSSFTDELTYTYEVPPFPSTTRHLTNRHVIGTWAEMTLGLKVKIWGWFWLGATGRLKFGLDLDGNGDLTSYDVVGYGRNFKSTWWGFNYYAMVRIPFKPKH
jgi:hypothetical protein